MTVTDTTSDREPVCQSAESGHQRHANENPSEENHGDGHNCLCLRKSSEGCRCYYEENEPGGDERET